MGQLTQYLCKWTVRDVCALLSPSSLLLFYENVSVMPSFLVFFFWSNSFDQKEQHFVLSNSV